MFSPKFRPKVLENSVASPRIDLGLKLVLGFFREFAPWFYAHMQKNSMLKSKENKNLAIHDKFLTVQTNLYTVCTN